MKKTVLLSLAAALLLASCNNGTSPPAAEALSGTVIEGKYVNQNGGIVFETSAWKGGAGKVSFNVLVDVNKALELSSVALDADGKFSFATLPVPEASTLRKITAEGEGCTNTFVVSDPAALNASASLTVSAQKSGQLVLLAYSNAGNGSVTIRTGTLIYADRAVTVKGVQTCKLLGTTLTLDFDLALVKGWNMTAATGSTKDAVTTVRNGNPGGAEWVYIDAAQPLGLPLFR